MINASDINLNDTDTNIDLGSNVWKKPLTIVGIISSFVGLLGLAIRIYRYRRVANRRNLTRLSLLELSFPENEQMRVLDPNYNNTVGPEDRYDSILRDNILALIHGLENDNHNFLKKEFKERLQNGISPALKQVNRLCSDLGLTINVDAKQMGEERGVQMGFVGNVHSNQFPINQFRAETFDKVANLILSDVKTFLDQGLSKTRRFSLARPFGESTAKRYRKNLAFFMNEENFTSLVAALKPKLIEIYQEERKAVSQKLRQVEAIAALNSDVIRIMLDYDTPTITPLWNLRSEGDAFRENLGTSLLRSLRSIQLSQLLTLSSGNGDDDEPPPPPPFPPPG